MAHGTQLRNDRRVNVRTIARVYVPVDCFGQLQAPDRAWSFPPCSLVRVRLASGATDWNLEAVTAVANICQHGSDVMIEGDDARLAAEFGVALGRHLHRDRDDAA